MYPNLHIETPAGLMYNIHKQAINSKPVTIHWKQFFLHHFSPFINTERQNNDKFGELRIFAF